MITTEDKLNVLSSIARRLNGAGITWALGGSAMLYLRGLTGEFHDLDIMAVLADAPAAGDILAQLGTPSPSESGGRYRTRYFHEFTVGGVDVDVIGGLVIVKGGVGQDCGLNAADIDGEAEAGGQKIPLHSLAVWRGYYELMGRLEKVRMIDAATEKQEAGLGRTGGR